MNSDAADPVVPDPDRVAGCMALALERAGLDAAEVQIVSTHATATELGDELEAQAIRQVFGGGARTYVNNTKSFIGHAMGAAGALELAGNLGAFDDGMVHPTINVTELDERCTIRNLVLNEPKEIGPVDCILNNSFGMLGTNSAVVVKRFRG
jgi:3-oxoacyl-[acyl-carrier-protein] synthase II